MLAPQSFRFMPNARACKLPKKNNHTVQRFRRLPNKSATAAVVGLTGNQRWERQSVGRCCRLRGFAVQSGEDEETATHLSVPTISKWSFCTVVVTVMLLSLASSRKENKKKSSFTSAAVVVLTPTLGTQLLEGVLRLKLRLELIRLFSHGCESLYFAYLFGPLHTFPSLTLEDLHPWTHFSLLFLPVFSSFSLPLCSLSLITLYLPFPTHHVYLPPPGFLVLSGLNHIFSRSAYSGRPFSLADAELLLNQSHLLQIDFQDHLLYFFFLILHLIIFFW